ncbi:oxygen-independent coproporphyrinogen III oxidase [Labilibaculum sp. DW002]|uniref:Coproporphyrinogen-III oxidase n=1 Tax=Paralabilibaculum antarcticum TaxID=2912572 RepID=A0ABT5VT48_9BACT|nr:MULTISPECIES: oxygen-independent coproporphyrinogen III oxidase [unclassified Labilibaculum]MBI9056857.1 oxygen-independent coproporphyrinogen III oxidase [Labilibaculum sp.]MDE5418599.1 oxygen-independent coproporphyrinogen III oxidase [Labilibaculum sp. DW002]
MDRESLINKYNVPVPRYTSYPTVPFWGNERPDVKQWLKVVKRTFDESNEAKGISVYVHLPYCERLCTYCACTKVITRNHGVEEQYIDAVLQEWQIYLNTFKEQPILRELHLGGGTPTFFSPENLKRLINGIKENAKLHPEHEFSFEGHPNNTTRDHLQALYDVGFRRVSYGVQDFDPEVQRVINRKQSFETVKEVTIAAREIGYHSVNFDLIYGLPKQELSSINDTFEKVSELKPDRIAYYSYAHVPWKTKGQRMFTDADIPDSAEKRELYELGKEKLAELGYDDVGMDHFSLPHDELFIAREANRLHRNFMGYNTSHTELLIGLGASSISDAKYAYSQNPKEINLYEKACAKGELDLVKGYFLTDEDLIVKQAILDITCRRELSFEGELKKYLPTGIKAELQVMHDEGIIVLTDDKLVVTDLGMIFLRNIAKPFDNKLRYSKSGEGNMFSKAI